MVPQADESRKDRGLGALPDIDGMICKHRCRHNRTHVRKVDKTSDVVLNRLVDDGYVEREEDAYLLVDPGGLLNAWAENGPPARERTAIPVEGDLRSAAEGLLDRFHGHAVISGELAAELLAPHLPAAGAVIHCLDAREWARIDLEEIEPSPPVFRAPGRILLDLPDAGVAQFGSEVSGLPLVGAAQLYVDLYKEPTRGRQAAVEVRRQLLDF